MMSDLSQMIRNAAQPGWLRPVAIIVSIALHGSALLAAARPADVDDTPLEAIEIGIAPPMGETLIEEAETADSIAQNETVASLKAIEKPMPVEEQIVEPAKILAPDTETYEVPVKQAEMPPEKHDEPPKESDPLAQIAPAATQQEMTVAATEESFARKEVGVENGLKKGGGMTKAAYAAAVKKQIAKNKKRAVGSEHGAVSISFVIGPQGLPEHVAIPKSSNHRLDETARDIITSIRLPPPPNGQFMAAVEIKFE